MLAWLCIIIHLSIYYGDTVDEATHTSPTFQTLFLGMATILFAFGGASSFPTIQNDMADRTQFGTSVLAGYAGQCVRRVEPGWSDRSASRLVMRIQ